MPLGLPDLHPTIIDAGANVRARPEQQLVACERSIIDVVLRAVPLARDSGHVGVLTLERAIASLPSPE